MFLGIRNVPNDIIFASETQIWAGFDGLALSFWYKTLNEALLSIGK